MSKNVCFIIVNRAFKLKMGKERQRWVDPPEPETVVVNGGQTKGRLHGDREIHLL